MKKWRCTVCGYIHEGPEPPDICPVCGVSKEFFEEIVEPPQQELKQASSQPTVGLELETDNLKEALYTLGYGLYVVSSRSGDNFNAQTANTVFQITSDPPQIAIGVNKANLTHQYIQSSQVVTVTVLGKGNMEEVKHFGYKSGHQTDKFAGVDLILSKQTGCPIIPEGTAYLDCKVLMEKSADLGTHSLFIAQVVDGGILRGSEPLSYAGYRRDRAKPAEFLDIDVANVITTLNLEYAAQNRYRRQIDDIQDPSLNSILTGVMRTEGDHVDHALEFLQQQLRSGSEGFEKLLLYMKLNLDFEEIATSTYKQFMKESRNDQLQAMFKEMIRSEAGHKAMFQQLMTDMVEGVHPVMFYCPICGWELDFGVRPQAGETIRCKKCGASLTLKLVNGNWTI